MKKEKWKWVSIFWKGKQISLKGLYKASNLGQTWKESYEV